MASTKNGVHDRLQIVVDQAIGHATEEGKGPVVGIKHHLLCFAGVGGDKHLPTVGQPEVGDLDGQRNAANLHVFLAPVKLAGITGCKDERHKGFFDRRPGLR